MNIDEMLSQLLAKKYQAPDAGPMSPIQGYKPPAQGGGKSSGVDPKKLGALANMFPKKGDDATPMEPIGDAGGKPVYNVPVDPAQGHYLPGGTPATAESAGIQQEQPGSEEWVRKIMSGVGLGGR